jgi:hypothetical protein
MARAVRQPVVLMKWYRVVSWMLDRVNHFPKNQRFVFGQRLAERSIHVLELLAEAAWSQDKTAILAQANREMEVLRWLVRLAHDRKILTAKQYEAAAEGIYECGRMVGGELPPPLPQALGWRAARPCEARQRHGEREELGGPRAARPQRTTPGGPARQTPQVGNHCLRAGRPGWRAVGGMTGSSRGLRGGNWNNNASNLSSSDRNTNDPSNENNNIGFRLASPCRLTQARSGGVRGFSFRPLRRQRLVSGTTPIARAARVSCLPRSHGAGKNRPDEA